MNSNSLFLPPDRHMVNQIPGDLVNETGDLHGISFSIIHSLGGTGKSQGLPCPGYADIAKTSLLFHGSWIRAVDRPVSRERVFFHTGHEHMWKFQSFGAMERH